MDRKDRKGGDKLFLHNLSICSQYLKEKVIVLSFIISIFHLEDSYTLGYSVLHQVIGFLKWVVNPFKMYVFFFFIPFIDLAYSFLTITTQKTENLHLIIW